jgi:hypothetical protein
LSIGSPRQRVQVLGEQVTVIEGIGMVPVEAAPFVDA